MKFDDKIPIYLQIKSYLYRQIITGQLQPGEKLPSVRQLAVDVTANVNTVQRSLSEMINEQIIDSQRGKGNFVTEDQQMIQRLKNKLVTQQIELVYKQLHAFNLSDDEIIAEVTRYIQDRGAINE